MNETIRKKISTYRRGIENQKVNTTVYAMILIFTVIVYGFAGAFPLYATVAEKFQTRSELIDLNSKLSAKKESIDAVRSKLGEAAFYIEELEKVISTETAVDKYMVGLVNIAATSGFKQRSLVLQGETDGKINLKVIFQGSETQLGSLLSSVEAMKRLTVIDSFNYAQREETANLEISLHVFHLSN